MLNKSVVGTAVFWSSVNAFLVKGAGFIAAIVVFRSLPPDAYGGWRVALSLTALVGGWLTAPLGMVAVEAIRAMADRREEGALVWRASMRWAAFAALGFALVATFFTAGISRVYPGTTPALILIVCWMTPLLVLKSYGISWVQARYQFRRQVLLNTLEQSVYVSTLLFCFWLWPGQVRALATAQLIVAFFALCIYVPELVRSLKEGPVSTWRQENAAFVNFLRTHGKWGVGVDVIKDLLDASRIWLIAVFLGPAAVGIYGLAESLLGYVASIINAGPAITAAFPRLIHEADRLKMYTHKCMRLGILVFLTQALVSWVGVPIFIPILFPKYVVAIPFYLGLSSIFIFGGLGFALNALFPALRWQKPLFIFSAIRLTWSVMVLVVAVPLFGIAGVIVEYVTSSLLFTILRFTYVQRRLQVCIPWMDCIIPRHADVKELWGLVADRAGRVLRRAT